MTLKVDVVNKAYSQDRISGLTTKPTPGEIEIGAFELESMMHEWLAAGVNLGYLFTTQQSYEPDPNEESNLPPWSLTGVIANLALRLLDYFGKSPSPTTVQKARAGMTVIEQQTYIPNDLPYPSRMPRGSGNTNRGYYFYRYYPKPFNPNTDQINQLYFGDVNNYRLDISDYLIGNESISNVSVKADSGIMVSILSQESTAISYQVKATTNGAENLSAQFTFNTDGGRTTTRVVYFTVLQKNTDNV